MISKLSDSSEKNQSKTELLFMTHTSLQFTSASKQCTHVDDNIHHVHVPAITGTASFKLDYISTCLFY